MNVQFLGLRLDALTMDESLEKSIDLIRMRHKQHVVLNASKVVLASNSPELRMVINGCDLVNADGMAVVWAARLLGFKMPERVAGVDYMHRLMDLAASREFTVYLLGGSSDVVQSTRTFFESNGVKVVGARDGYWNKDTELDVVDNIRREAPDILFLAIPSPQKEYFLHTHLHNLNCGLAVGVGGSFDIVAGKTRRAPKWMQAVGLEWLYRLLQEPRRMFKRYLVGNTKFVLLVFRELLMKKRRKEIL